MIVVESQSAEDKLLKRLLQAKIAGIYLQKARGEITEGQYGGFINGVNFALKEFGLRYSIEAQEVKKLDGAVESQPPSDILELAYFKRGFFLVERNMRDTKQEFPNGFDQLAEYVREL